MKRYAVFGLTVESEINLPELSLYSGGSDIDVEIQIGDVRKLPGEKQESHGLYLFEENTAYVYVSEIARFSVSNGDKVTIQPLKGVEEEAVRLYLLGAILGVVLHQRGMLVLHASAVKIDGQAVLFVGEKGAGKSTMAATIGRMGYPLLTDDIMPVSISGDDTLLAFSGPGQLKLWPESLRLLGEDPESVPRLHGQVAKRSKLVNVDNQQQGLGVGAIYALCYEDTFRRRRLSGREAFDVIVTHSFFRKWIRAMGISKNHFRNCADVARMVPVYGLARPKGLDMIEEHSSYIINEMKLN